jgi:hypothetical protein
MESETSTRKDDKSSRFPRMRLIRNHSLFKKNVRLVIYPRAIFILPFIHQRKYSQQGILMKKSQ